MIVSILTTFSLNISIIIGLFFIDFIFLTMKIIFRLMSLCIQFRQYDIPPHVLYFFQQYDPDTIFHCVQIHYDHETVILCIYLFLMKKSHPFFLFVVSIIINIVILVWHPFGISMITSLFFIVWLNFGLTMIMQLFLFWWQFFGLIMIGWLLVILLILTRK